MSEYYRFSDNPNIISTYTPLFGCFNDIFSCFVGMFCPSCLFGIIYKKANFGKCWIGCLKLSFLQFIINFFFSSILFSIEWDLLLSPQYTFSENKKECISQNPSCVDLNEYNSNLTYLQNNNCTLPSNITICNCSKQVLYEECHYNKDSLKQDFYLCSVMISILSIINILVFFCCMGSFLGHYRNKISHKYNILYNSKNNFLLYCLPCTSSCALCQEYQTVRMLETIYPTKPTNNLNNPPPSKITNVQF